LFLGIHTFTIKYTSQVYLEALPALTSALTVVSYERWHKHPQRYGWLALSGAGLGLTAASKYLYAVVGITILLHWTMGQEWKTLFKARRRLTSALLPMIGWGLLSLAVFFACNPYLWSDPVNRLRESVFFHAGYTQSQNVLRAGLPTWQPLVWLFGSVPWHPGVFLVSFDLGITLFALLGLRRTWKKRPLYVLWIATALAFLLVWRTKWPQYILILTFPWSLVAAEGVASAVIEPLRDRLARLTSKPSRAHHIRQQGWQALPWLMPGLAVIALITFFPLLYQGAIAMTDFRATAIRDGLNGGVWREVWLGLSGQVQAIAADFSPYSRVTEVHYTGLNVLLPLLTATPAQPVFNLLWTVLVVGLQGALGVGAALLLNRPGVRFRNGWQTLFILPWAIPEFVGALSWLQIFHPDNGWFATLSASYTRVNGNPFAQALAGWQNDPETALGVLLIAGTWMGFPLMMLAATAGLKMIPDEIHDAAAMDGAGWWAHLRYVTFPVLLPLLAPVIVIRAIFAFNQFYLFYVLRPPNPMYTLASAAYFLFDGGLYAVSAGASILTVLILLIIILWFNRRSTVWSGGYHEA
jgi:ABC-type sugar transport system permease subunit